MKTSAAAVVLGLLLGVSYGSGQEPSRNAQQETFSRRSVPTVCLTPPYCSDAKRNDAGELINQDYFVAKQSKETIQLLQLVDTYHTNNILPLIGKGEYGGALNDIKYTLNRFPNHPMGLILMALYARLTKGYALAPPYYDKAIRLYPQHALTHAQYGAYSVTTGSVDEGIKKLGLALEMDPQLVFAHVWLAAVYYKTGNVERARESEAKARDLGYSGKISIDALQNLPAGK